MEIVQATTAFALLITKLVDFIRNAFDQRDAAPKWVWNLVAFGLGIVIAQVWAINVFPEVTPLQENTGRILTGLGMAAAGSGWHEILDALSSTAKKARPGASSGSNP